MKYRIMQKRSEEKDLVRHRVTSCMARFRRQPDSLWSWLVCFASFVALVINNGTYYTFGLLLPPLMKEFQQSNAIVGKCSPAFTPATFKFGKWLEQSPVYLRVCTICELSGHATCKPCKDRPSRI